MKSFLLFFLLTAAFLKSFAGIITGKVIDKRGHPLAFVNIYPKNISKGTTTNAEGNYRLMLENGKYEIVFKLIGYRLLTKEIVVSDSAAIVRFDATLEEEQYYIDEVVVKKNRRDPAYDIIEKAQEKRKYYKDEEIKSFTCKAYVKSLGKLGKATIKNKILGLKLFDTPKLPENKILYFSESLSKISYLSPDHYKEHMISSKVSGQAKAYSFATAIAMFSEVNFYNNYLPLGEVYERPFISPIASNAFNYYDYELIETFSEHDFKIHKIKVIPWKARGPVFHGYIYILDDSWRIHSLNLTIDKGTGIEYVDTLNIQQTFAPQNDNIWALINQKFNIKFDINIAIASATGSGYIVGIFSDYKMEPFKKILKKAGTVGEPVDAQPEYQSKKEIRKELKKLKQQFNNELLVVEKDANNLDSSAWNQIRPIPLTIEEIKDYKEKDSVAVVVNSKEYKDSTDNRHNKFKVNNLIFGYSYRNSGKKRRFQFEPIYSGIQYNTMEGVVINPSFIFTQRFENGRFIRISPDLRYGFSNTHFNAKAEFEYMYNPIKWSSFKISGGKFVSDFNSSEAITPFVNALYTLFYRRNYLKMYEKTFLEASYSSELINGIYLSTRLEYAWRHPLENTTDYSFYTNKNVKFTPNNPPSTGQDYFKTNNALIFHAALKFVIRQQYLTYPKWKVRLPSKYPEFTIRYKKGITGLLGSSVNFDFLALQVDKKLDLKRSGEAKLEIYGGGFINSQAVTFADYKHFNGNLTIFSRNISNSFRLLDYYTYSTDNYFIEGHWEHHLNGYITNRLPVVKNLGWQLVNGVNYLYTPFSGNYAEFSLGLEHMFKYFRIDYTAGYGEKINFRQGIRIGIGF